jgi:hypothetical protein
MSPSERVAQLYSQPAGSLFDTFYNLQGYGGVIPAHFHMGSILNDPTTNLCVKVPLFITSFL